MTPHGAATLPRPTKRRLHATYVANLEKACAPIGLDFKRRSKAVSTVWYGPSKAGDRSFSPKPSRAGRRRNQIAPRKGLRSEVAPKAPAGRLFSE